MTCSVDGCDRPIRYKGMCGMHYKRQWRHGDPNKFLVLHELPDSICNVDGCENAISHSNGYCKVHEQRLRRYGRLENVNMPKSVGGPNVAGYWVNTVNGKRVYEHRQVAEEKLGRRLLPGEVVHHIDGDTFNNNPSNLEILPNQATHARYHAHNKNA